MSETKEQEVAEKLAAEPVQPEPTVPEPTPSELQARDSGWVPKEEWVAQGRDADEWRTAKEFNDRGQLYKTIHQTNRELKQTQAQLGALRKHNEYIFEKAFLKAKEELKREKRAALREQNFEAVEAIDEEMEKLQTDHKKEIQSVRQTAAVAVAPNETPPELREWMDKNKWYEKDEELRDHADAAGLVYFKKHPQATPAEVLNYIARDVLKKFPDKFGKRAAPNAVAGVDRTNKKGSSTDIELDDFEHEIMTQLVKSGEMTEKEYKDQLKKAKGIK